MRKTFCRWHFSWAHYSNWEGTVKFHCCNIWQHIKPENRFLPQAWEQIWTWHYNSTMRSVFFYRVYYRSKVMFGTAAQVWLNNGILKIYGQGCTHRVEWCLVPILQMCFLFTAKDSLSYRYVVLHLVVRCQRSFKWTNGWKSMLNINYLYRYSAVSVPIDLGNLHCVIATFAFQGK